MVKITNMHEAQTNLRNNGRKNRISKTRYAPIIADELAGKQEDLRKNLTVYFEHPDRDYQRNCCRNLCLEVMTLATKLNAALSSPE
jgi:hypothetical protein